MKKSKEKPQRLRGKELKRFHEIVRIFVDTVLDCPQAKITSKTRVTEFNDSGDGVYDLKTHVEDRVWKIFNVDLHDELGAIENEHEDSCAIYDYEDCDCDIEEDELIGDNIYKLCRFILENEGKKKDKKETISLWRLTSRSI